MYYFIVNPASCSGKGRMIWSKIRQELTRQRIPYQCVFTKKRGDATRIASSFCSFISPCTIVAVGGDGTANEVLNGISPNKNILFGYIPTGSSNDLARSLNLPTDPLKALFCILHPKKILLVDIGSVSDDIHERRFTVSAGIGFDAAICHEAFHSPIKPILNQFHLGRLTYAAIAVHQLFVLKMTPMNLLLDGKQKIHFQKAYMAAIMNHPCEGGGVYFCPDAAYNDQYLDICVLEGIPRVFAAFVLLLAFKGKHKNLPHVHIFRCKTVKIHTKYKLPVHLDGEVFGICKSISASVTEQKLHIIVN